MDLQAGAVHGWGVRQGSPFRIACSHVRMFMECPPPMYGSGQSMIPAHHRRQGQHAPELRPLQRDGAPFGVAGAFRREPVQEAAGQDEEPGGPLRGAEAQAPLPLFEENARVVRPRGEQAGGGGQALGWFGGRVWRLDLRGIGGRCMCARCVCMHPSSAVYAATQTPPKPQPQHLYTQAHLVRDTQERVVQYHGPLPFRLLPLLPPLVLLGYQRPVAAAVAAAAAVGRGSL